MFELVVVVVSKVYVDETKPKVTVRCLIVGDPSGLPANQKLKVY
jgi:hypothetical protein